jgi:hypothetical protein
MTQVQRIKEVLLKAPHGLYLREITEATGLCRQNINKALRHMEMAGEVKVVLVGLKKYLPTKSLSLSVPKRGRPPAVAAPSKVTKSKLPAHRTGPIVARPLSIMEMLA